MYVSTCAQRQVYICFIIVLVLTQRFDLLIFPRLLKRMDGTTFNNENRKEF